MLRRLFRRLTTGAGLHPDLTIDAVTIDTDFPAVTPVSSFTKPLAVDLHPDLDWDGGQFGCQDLCDPRPVDALDVSISLEDLQVEEDRELRSPSGSKFSSPHVDEAEIEEDWDFELAWSEASGRSDHLEPAQQDWHAFDFDVADLGPDPEALEEAVFPGHEGHVERERRLDNAAVELVLSLGAFRSSDRLSLFRRFRAIVEEFQHPASHAALHRMLTEGASLEELEEASQLRCLWRDSTWLWAQKRNTLSAWSVRRSPSRRLAFGWPTAIRLIRVYGQIEAERSMQEDWFDTWISLERSKATSETEEMAFYTYAGFLRQLTPDIRLDDVEGIMADPADIAQFAELRDRGGNLIWKFERKPPPRDGDFSLEPPRIRNHRAFEEAALESSLGLAELSAVDPAEAVEAGFVRRYIYPEQPYVGGSCARARVSTLLCRGIAKIVSLDDVARELTLHVPHDQKRLLAETLSLIVDAPPHIARVTQNDAEKRSKEKKKRSDL